MKRTLKLGVAASAALGCLMTAGIASAQVQAEGEVGMALPGAQPQAGAVAGESDHDQMIGRVAVGYMGAFRVPLATNPDIVAPAIGVRYWIDQMLGLDIGLGFYNDGGSTTTDSGGVSNTVDDASRTAVLIHAGVPLSLASSGHFSFQIVPELNLGYAMQTVEDSVPPPVGGDTENTGLVFDIGARAGAEIHFGFIGIPELSLQGSVGVLFSTETTKTTTKPNQGPETSTTVTSSSLRTTVYNAPWDIFVSNVAALYYF